MSLLRACLFLTPALAGAGDWVSLGKGDCSTTQDGLGAGHRWVLQGVKKNQKCRLQAEKYTDDGSINAYMWDEENNECHLFPEDTDMSSFTWDTSDYDAPSYVAGEAGQVYFGIPRDGLDTRECSRMCDKDAGSTVEEKCGVYSGPTMAPSEPTPEVPNFRGNMKLNINYPDNLDQSAENRIQAAAELVLSTATGLGITLSRKTRGVLRLAVSAPIETVEKIAEYMKIQKGGKFIDDLIVALADAGLDVEPSFTSFKVPGDPTLSKILMRFKVKDADDQDVRDDLLDAVDETLTGDGKPSLVDCPKDDQGDDNCDSENVEIEYRTDDDDDVNDTLDEVNNGDFADKVNDNGNVTVTDVGAEQQDVLGLRIGEEVADLEEFIPGVVVGPAAGEPGYVNVSFVKDDETVYSNFLPQHLCMDQEFVHDSHTSRYCLGIGRGVTLGGGSERQVTGHVDDPSLVGVLDTVEAETTGVDPAGVYVNGYKLGDEVQYKTDEMVDPVNVMVVGHGLGAGYMRVLINYAQAASESWKDVLPQNIVTETQQVTNAPTQSPFTFTDPPTKSPTKSPVPTHLPTPEPTPEPTMKENTGLCPTGHDVAKADCPDGCDFTYEGEDTNTGHCDASAKKTDEDKDDSKSTEAENIVPIIVFSVVAILFIIGYQCGGRRATGNSDGDWTLQYDEIKA